MNKQFTLDLVNRNEMASIVASNSIDLAIDVVHHHLKASPDHVCFVLDSRQAFKFSDLTAGTDPQIHDRIEYYRQDPLGSVDIMKSLSNHLETEVQLRGKVLVVYTIDPTDAMRAIKCCQEVNELCSGKFPVIIPVTPMETPEGDNRPDYVPQENPIYTTGKTA